MDSDFHYYGTGTAAVSSGFDSSDSQVIAFAAQFVDWFDSDYWSYWQIVNDQGKPVKDSRGRRYQYSYPQLSVQSIGPKMAIDFKHSIWNPFHFPPGNLPYKVKGDDWKCEFNQRHQIRKTGAFKSEAFKLCRPYSQFALDLIQDTVDQFRTLSNLRGAKLADYTSRLLGSRERCPVADGRKLALYLLGVRMHVFVDTWAHQDFVGEQNEINAAGIDSPLEVKNKQGKYRKVDWVGILYSAYERTDLSRAPDYTKGNDLVCAGHSQIGCFPDFSWISYRYPAAWLPRGEKYLERDNPREFSEAWSWMEFVLGLCGESRTGADTPDPTPSEIEKVLHKPQPMSNSRLTAFAASELDWAKTKLAKQFLPPVFNNFTATDWPQLDKAKLGLFDGMALTRFGTINVKRESVLQYMELASAMHYQFYYDWVRKNKAYTPVKPRRLWKPKT